MRRDLALLVDRDVTFAALRRIAFAAEKKLLRKRAKQEMQAAIEKVKLIDQEGNKE